MRRSSTLRRSCLLIRLLLGIASGRAAGPTIAIDATAPAARVSPLLYGLMTEINHAYGGGLYAELIHNRAFIVVMFCGSWQRMNTPLFASSVAQNSRVIWNCRRTST